MKRKTKFAILMVLALAVAAVPVLAAGRGGGHGCGMHGGMHGGGPGEWMAARVTAHLEDALAQAKATPAQTAAVMKEKDELLRTMQQGRGGHHGEMGAVLALFTADKLDEQAIAKQREKAVQHHGEVVHALAGALTRVHAQFDAAQRKALVAYVQAELPQGAGGWRGRMKQHMVENRVEAALTAIQATPAQRKQLSSVRDRVVKQFEAQRATRRAEIDKVLALFQQDRVDAREVEKLEQQQDARTRDMADQMLGAAKEVHAALTPAQRKQLADFVKANRPGGHGK